MFKGAPSVVVVMQTIREMMVAQGTPPWSIIIHQLSNYRESERKEYCVWWKTSNIEVAVIRHCAGDENLVGGINGR